MSEKTLFPKKIILTEVDSTRMSNTRLTCKELRCSFYCQGGNGNLLYTSPIYVYYVQEEVHDSTF